MKKLIFIIPAALLFISSCKPEGPSAADIKNDSLTSVVDNRDSSLADFINTFNEIESNLDSVAARQQIITMGTDNIHGEFKGKKKEHINAQIAAINELMDRNRKEMEGLKQRLKSSGRNNALLEKTIKTLTIQLSQKDYELCELNLKLDALNVKVTKLVATVDSLDSQNYIKSLIINAQTKDMQIAYYRIGEAKELREDKIIDRKGGVLGIGRTSELSEDFNTSTFTKIDYTKTTVIPVNGDGIKIITSHPTDSYKLDKDDTKKDRTTDLVILDPVKFWSASKYLVIVRK